jgi:hypothetical protein
MEKARCIFLRGEHVDQDRKFTQGKRDEGTLKKIGRASFFIRLIARHLFRFWFPTRAFRILELKGNPVQYRSCPRNCKFEFRCTAVKKLLQIPAIGSSELRRPAKVKRARRPA